MIRHPNRLCPSMRDIEANMSESTFFNDTNLLPYGYNVGDILNMPSFNVEHVWPPKGNGYTNTVAGTLARNFKKSVLGLYFMDQNHEADKNYERSPSLQKLKLAVDFYGTWIMDADIKAFCDDLLTKKTTILVHIRSCDTSPPSESYLQNIYETSKQFDTVVLTGGCHADERYAKHETASKNLLNGVEAVYNRMRGKGAECKLLMLPNYNTDHSLYAFRVASNLMVERGGFAAAGSLLSQGNVYLDHKMSTYYFHIDFKHFISNAKLLWKHDESNEYKSVFDKMARVVPTKCLFETFGSGDESKRMCVTPALHDENCWIMSIGCNGLFGFETDIFHRTSCSVHMFDCTGDWEVPKNISSRVFLHKLCIGPKELSSGNRSFLPYQDIVSSISDKVHAIRPLYLKMDVEGFEFQVLPAILQLPIAVQPIQIGFELHLITYINASPEYSQSSKNSMWFIKDKSDVGLLFYKLETFGGYKLISRDDDPFCPSCTEVVVMKYEF